MIRLNNRIIFIFIFLVTFILYYPSLNSYFVNDDYNWIKEISFYEVISSFWGGWGHGALYRPLTRLLLYFEFLLFEKNPAGYHIVSLFLHSTVLFLVFRTAALIFSSKAAGYTVLILSLFFFPFHEAVCWISSQTVILGSVFVSLSLLCFINYIINKNSRYFYYSLAACLLSLLSYESSIVLPALCFISFFMFNEFNFKSIKKIITLLIPFIILSAAYLIYRKIVLSGLPEANELTADITRWFLNYAAFLNHQVNKNTPVLILTAISLAGLFLLKKSQWKYVIFSLSWVFITYLPFSIIGGYTGRFAYYSLFGIIFFISYMLISLTGKYSGLKIPVIILVSAYCFINIYKTNENARYWHEAGEIARGIPLQLKNLHPDFPENSTLIFYDIPAEYSHSGVFLTYFEDVIQSNYPVKINIIKETFPGNNDLKKEDHGSKENVFRFRYYLSERELKELN